jgi:hypothetical protein
MERCIACHIESGNPRAGIDCALCHRCAVGSGGAGSGRLRPLLLPGERGPASWVDRRGTGDRGRDPRCVRVRRDAPRPGRRAASTRLHGCPLRPGPEPLEGRLRPDGWDLLGQRSALRRRRSARVRPPGGARSGRPFRDPATALRDQALAGGCAPVRRGESRARAPRGRTRSRGR